MKTIINKGSNICFVVLCFVCLVFLYSCKKWLDKKPDTGLSTPETLADLQALLSNTLYMNFERTASLPELSADDYFAFDNNVLAYPETYARAYIWKKQLANDNNDWVNDYIPIYNHNICLDQLPKIERTSNNAAQWDNVKGSALVFRSYYFLNLTWAFGKAYDESSSATDPGIVLRLGSDFTVPSVRSSVKACYEQIINDTKIAIPLLPAISVHPTQPSKGVAYGLLARTYLSMRVYDSAFKYSDLALQINSQLMDYNNDPEIGNINGNIPPFAMFNKETLFFSQANTDNLLYAAILSGMVDTSLYSSYDANDLRKTAFFYPSGGYYKFKGNYGTTNGFGGTASSYFSGIATDELYLIRAECFARLNNKDAALADLNYLLVRRWKTGFFIPVTTATSTAALDIILVERRKKLVFRYLRWIDIKRLNKEGRNIIPKRILSGTTYTLPPNDDRYALPLPQDIIDITGMQQNPGW